jgi:hypothetical protein
MAPENHSWPKKINEALKMSDRVYLKKLPDSLANFYYGTQRFYLEYEQAKNLEQSLLVYASALLTREKLLPYEALLQAAGRQNIGEAVRLFHEEGAGEFPGLVQALRLLLKPKTLAQAPNDPVVQLIAAPLWIKDKFFEPQSLARRFPQQAEYLLSLAFLNDVQMDWENELESSSTGAIACLALAQKKFYVSEIIAKLYAREKNFKVLCAWLIHDPEGALNTAREQAGADDQLNLLALHGDLCLLSERAHLFLNVSDDFVRDGLMLLFGELPKSRCIYNKALEMPEWFFEPTQVKWLCSREARIIPSNAKGWAMEHFRLRDKYHENR